MKKQDIDFLVFGKPRISKKEITEMISTLESGWIGTGPKTKLFEDQFSQYVESKNAIASQWLRGFFWLRCDESFCEFGGACSKLVD